MKTINFKAWTLLTLLGTFNRITADNEACQPKTLCEDEYPAGPGEYTFTGIPQDDGGYQELNKPVDTGKIRTSMLFATPLLQVSLSSYVDDLEGFNQRLSDLIMEDYREYERLTKARAADAPEETNNDFYTYQTGNRADFVDEDYKQRHLRYKNAEEFRLLRRLVRQLAGDLLVKVYGAVPDDATQPLFSATSVDPWAAVHFEKSRHGLHFHKGSVLSAVYYVRVPGNAGDILLHDPRGPRPPFFGTEIRITPHEGDLIMFPSWLGHEVEETGATKEPRISIPFNLDGEWEETINARVHKLEEDAAPLEPLKSEKVMRRG